ncbi:MAG: hypothetical protein K0Q81_666 [Paenibacillus sp.]|jgi:hypothetical protein|nr:hypothetical protein [Paenibacillus sp.]
MTSEEMAKNLGDLIDWLDVEIPELKEHMRKEQEYQARLVERKVKSA